MAASKDNVSKTTSGRGGRAGRDVRTGRRAAGLNVAVSVVAAVCLVVVINIISSQRYFRGSAQTLGRYGLSDTAKAILAELEGPVRLTSIYTSVEKGKEPEKYLPQVRDVLEEIRDAKEGVTVMNVTSDRQKAEVLRRLRDRLDQQAADHVEVIQQFDMLANKQAQQYEMMAREWQKYPATGWLSQFGVAKAVERAAGATRDELRKAANELRDRLDRASLPDYDRICDDIASTLASTKEGLERIRQLLIDLSGLPEKAQQAREKLTRAAREVGAAVEEATKNLGKPEAAVPGDPGKVLERFATDAQAMSSKAEAARGALEELNPEGKEYVQYAQAWRLGQAALPQCYAGLAFGATSLARDARGARASLNVEAQGDVVRALRTEMGKVKKLADACTQGVGQLLDELTRLDDATRKVFEKAKEEEYLKNKIEPVAKLQEKAKGLKKLDDQRELIDNIKEENIVIVEVGDKAGVVPFDDVWPLARQSEQMSFDADREERRAFYGDMAICTKMLGMTSEPLAEVVLAFYEEAAPPVMWQQRMPYGGPILSMQLTRLRDRLEKADLEVTEWNLRRDEKPPQAKPGRPQVLLVLPPPDMPPPMPGMGGEPPKGWDKEQTQKIREMIEGGTPAVFLAGSFGAWFMGRPTTYLLGEYLREQWDLEVKTDHQVVQGEPDQENPGKFQMPLLRLTWLPLWEFSNHPIARPLKARRLYWLSVCPVTVAQERKTDATITPLLTVPPTPRGLWASGDSEKLLDAIRESGGEGLAPGKDDLLPPFPVAAHARRKIGQTMTQIVVLGVGLSYLDGYMNSPVLRLAEKDVLAKPEPPPTGDMDLVTNAVYYLSGKTTLVGAGPSVSQPIELIGETTLKVIQLGFGLLWPAAVLAAGGVVMLFRRR